MENVNNITGITIKVRRNDRKIYVRDVNTFFSRNMLADLAAFFVALSVTLRDAVRGR